MQQVEQGKLNLDADVNQYLDFKIPPYQGKPVTLRNIMTHTAGFEEQVKDLITTDEKDAVAYDALLKRWVPERVYAPGTDAGLFQLCDLARRLHRRSASRASLSTIMSTRHIFAPLGMTRSTFRQPLPAQLQAAAGARATSRDRTSRSASRSSRPAPAGQPVLDRRRHGALHDRAPQPGRRDPPAAHRAADAQHRPTRRSPGSTAWRWASTSTTSTAAG